jgi:hypothetical protein
VAMCLWLLLREANDRRGPMLTRRDEVADRVSVNGWG